MFFPGAAGTGNNAEEVGLNAGARLMRSISHGAALLAASDVELLSYRRRQF